MLLYQLHLFLFSFINATRTPKASWQKFDPTKGRKTVIISSGIKCCTAPRYGDPYRGCEKSLNLLHCISTYIEDNFRYSNDILLRIHVTNILLYSILATRARCDYRTISLWGQQDSD